MVNISCLQTSPYLNAYIFTNTHTHTHTHINKSFKAFKSNVWTTVCTDVSQFHHEKHSIFPLKCKFTFVLKASELTTHLLPSRSSSLSFSCRLSRKEPAFSWPFSFDTRLMASYVHGPNRSKVTLEARERKRPRERTRDLLCTTGD